jgi:hypothetical protein
LSAGMSGPFTGLLSIPGGSQFKQEPRKRG